MTREDWTAITPDGPVGTSSFHQYAFGSVDLTAVENALTQHQIELPSWAFGNSGTRFKVFGQPGVPRTPYEMVVPSGVSGPVERAMTIARSAPSTGGSDVATL